MGCISLAVAAASHILTHLTPTARHLPVCFALGVNIAFPRAELSIPACIISLFKGLTAPLLYMIILPISSFLVFKDS